MRLQPLVRDRERLSSLLNLRKTSLCRRELSSGLPDRNLLQGAVPTHASSVVRPRIRGGSSGIEHRVRVPAKVGHVVLRRRIRDRQRVQFGRSEVSQELAQLDDAATGKDAERPTLVVVEVARRGAAELLQEAFPE